VKDPEFKIIQPLKEDDLSKTDLAIYQGEKAVVRDLKSLPGYSRWLARWLAGREKRILKRMNAINNDSLPRLLFSNRNYLIRSYVEGEPLNKAKVHDPVYFHKAMKLIDELHQHNITHNDLEKPENWIVMQDGSPGFIDFQLSVYMKLKHFRLFSDAKIEDRRHVIKNKRRFCREHMTEADWDIIRNRTWSGRMWKKYYKPLYNFITRKIFNYSDRANSKYSR
jgi:RIO-like serine/threonine protein kinase